MKDFKEILEKIAKENGTTPDVSAAPTCPEKAELN